MENPVSSVSSALWLAQLSWAFEGAFPCVGKLCSASLQAQPNHRAHQSCSCCCWFLEMGLQHPQNPAKIPHWATVLGHFTNGKGNLVCRKQTANILYQFFLNCFFSGSASLLPYRDEHPRYFLLNAWKWGVVPWSCNYSLWEGCQRETAHYSPLSNIVKCTRIICNTVRCCKGRYWLEGRNRSKWAKEEQWSLRAGLQGRSSFKPDLCHSREHPTRLLYSGASFTYWSSPIFISQLVAWLEHLNGYRKLLRMQWFGLQSRQKWQLLRSL